MNLIDRAISLLSRIPQSAISLLARVIIGLVFFKSGLTKLDGFGLSDSALFLFQEEYRLPLLNPWLAAHLATLAELTMPILLFAGFAARFAAAALLGMTLVIEVFVYPEAYVLHGLWAVALLTIMAHGAGVVSIDHLLRSRSGAIESRI